MTFMTGDWITSHGEQLVSFWVGTTDMATSQLLALEDCRSLTLTCLKWLPLFTLPLSLQSWIPFRRLCFVSSIRFPDGFYIPRDFRLVWNVAIDLPIKKACPVESAEPTMLHNSFSSIPHTSQSTRGVFVEQRTDNVAQLI